MRRIRSKANRRLIAAGCRTGGRQAAWFDPEHEPFRRDLALDVIFAAAKRSTGLPGPRGRLMVRDLDRASLLSGGSWRQVSALARRWGLG